MKIIVNAHKCEIDKSPVNEQEINITKCEFEFAEEITSEYVKEAYFTLNGATYKQIIVNNECDIPSEVLEKKGQIELGVVCYLVENEQEIKRYNPSPCYFTTLVGSLKDAENTEPITPSEMEQYEQALQDGLSEVADKIEEIEQAISETDNLDIDASKTGTTATVTITKKDGTEKSVLIQDGQTGATGSTGRDGVDGFSPIANVSKNGNTATITITDKNGTTTATVNDGQNGTNGQNGITPTIGDNGNWYLGNTDTGKPSRGATGQNGADGQDGVGVPSGGTKGQVLTKNSLTNYDTVWANIEAGIKEITQDTNMWELNAGAYLLNNNQIKLYYKNNGNYISMIGQVFIYDFNATTKYFEGYLAEGQINGANLGTQNLTGWVKTDGTRSELLRYNVNEVLLTSGQQTVTAKKTFNVLPESSNVPTNDNQLVNKKYVDDLIGNINTVLASLTTPSNGGN